MATNKAQFRNLIQQQAVGALNLNFSSFVVHLRKGPNVW